MPFSGPDDDKLPGNVQKLTKPQREKWVKTWNATFENCRDESTGGGAGSVEKCETVAFRIANGTIKKEVDMEDLREPTQAEKAHFGSDIVEVAVAPKPFGGAQNFDELEQFTVAQEQSHAVRRTVWETQDLINNVMDDDEDIEQKPNKLQKIVDGMRSRIATLMADASKIIGPDEKQTTKTEDGVKFRASDYAIVGDREKPSTWKLRLAEGSSGNFTVQQVARAITAMQPSGFRGQKVELSSEDKGQAKKRISAAMAKTDGSDDQKENLQRRLARIKEKQFPFLIIKDKDGNMRWLGIPTNKWRDRDNPPQIISEEAHKEFVAYLDRTKEFPVLLAWHAPGTRIGIADTVDYLSGFLAMGGPIDKGKEAEAERLAEKCQTEDIGMSHGFVYTYSDKENEIIGRYRTWEVSHLPMARCANVWTSLDVLKKEVTNVPFDKDKRAYLVSVHGEEAVADLEGKATDLEKDLLSVGAEFKELVELPAQPEMADVVEAVTKAIVENEGFKSLITIATSTRDEIKELKETTIPDLIRRVEAVEATAKEAEKTAKQSVDDIISAAFSSKSPGFQPSKEGEAPSTEEKKKEEETQVDTPGLDPKMAAGVFGPAIVGS